MLQLAAIGVDDIYLTGNPQITMFKMVYRRHINFSIFDDYILTKSGGNFSSKTIFNIERKADLLHKTYLLVEIPKILLKKFPPTFKYISNILNSYGIIWTYSNNDDDLVTLTIYNNSIIDQINIDITLIINNYNFFVNSIVLSSDSDKVITGAYDFLSRLTDTTDTDHDQTIIDIKSNITNGRNISMSLFYKMITMYIKEYTSDSILSFYPSNDIYTVASKDIMIYSNEFKELLINKGILLGILTAYTYDTLIYNTEDDSAINTIDNHTSIPLFNGILDRGTNLKSKIIPFKLYNSDDIRYLHYITFLNNITRILIVSDETEIKFDAKYATILKGTDISISDDNISKLTPELLSIDESILFYHIMDTDITNFIVYQYNLGENTKVYFDNNIGKVYDIANKYYENIPVIRDNIDKTDAYKIYKTYMQNVIENDIANNKIKSAQHAILIADIIKYNIDINIRYNFNQISNALTILYNATRDNIDSYILSFYKSFTFSSTTGVYTPAVGSSFVPIIENTSENLNDNFSSILNIVFAIPTSEGILVKNFFNEYIQIQIDNFITSCQNQMRSINYDTYMDYYKIWSRLLFQSGNTLLETYTNVNNNVVPDTSVFGKIAFMNYIPFLVAKDIPNMIFDTFETYGKTIFIDIGSDTTDNSTNYDNFIQLIDFRDSIDDTIKQITKKEIYERIINNVFVETISGTDQITNNNYFSELQETYATGTTYLICCSLRPDSFLSKYSTQDSDGYLVDISSDPKDLIYLPIEWLTQTYYQIFKAKIDTYVDSLDISSTNKTTGKTLLNGIVMNIINCFIIHSDIPKFSDYQNNKFSMLGLIKETNSTFQKYKKTIASSEIITATPQYSDAISSIWYQTQKKFIQLYNELYNDTIISDSYYEENLGNIMGYLHDHIKSVIIGDDIENTVNPYYDSDNEYTDIILDTIKESVNTITEIYPAVNTKGFDFYRLTNLGDPDVSTTKAYNITIFMKDYIALYSYILEYYNKHKTILQIKNDSNGLLYKDDLENTKTRRKDTFLFDRSNIINEYLSVHEKIKYIDNNSDIDDVVKTTLTELIDNTQIYWNPYSNNNGVYGVLDSIYNEDLIGNIYTTIIKIDTLPDGKNTEDYIDYQSNPFDSFCLHDWYYNIAISNIITYERLDQIKAIFISLIYETDNVTPKITSQILTKNKNLSKLYSDETKISFANITYVAWFFFDLVIESLILNTKIPFDNMIMTINNDATNTINKLNELFKSYIEIYLKKYKKISELQSTTPIDKINGFYQFFDIENTDDNTDIIYYKESIHGKYIVNAKLEIRLLDIINTSPPMFAWVKELGHKIIKEIDITIGGQQIDIHTSELLHFIYQLNKDENQERGYNMMIGNTEDMITLSHLQRDTTLLYIPLRFWFCKHVGNSLPLLNLLYSDIVINVKINDLSNLLYIDHDSYLTKQPKLKCKLLGQYIYLDEDERAKMANSKLEYLIEKYNYNGEQIYSNNNLLAPGANIVSGNEFMDINIIDPIAVLNIKISDPIKYLIWYIKFRDKKTEQPIDILDWNRFGFSVRDINGNMINMNPIISQMHLKIMGVTREQAREENYFTHVIPYNKLVPSLKEGHYMYSFANYPLILQPTGSANYTEIEDSVIIIRFTDNLIKKLLENENLEATIELWGCAYGIFRVLSGFGAMAFYK